MDPKQNENTDPPADQNPPADATQDTGGNEGEGGDGGDGTEDFQRKFTNAQNAAKRAARERDKLKAELAALRAKGTDKPDADPPLDAKAIAEAARSEARQELMKDRALDKIEVLAAKTFANPDIARRLLSTEVDQFVVDGKVDTDAIKDALADLLETNPFLGATPEKRFKGGADGGPRGGGKEKTLDDQIREARARGASASELIHLENQRLIPHIQKAFLSS